MFVISYSLTFCVYIPGNREFVFIIIVKFMMTAYSRIRFGLKIVYVYLYITWSHYLNFANLSEDIELINVSQIYFVERVCEQDKAYSLSYPLYYICGVVCFQFAHFPCDHWENIYSVLLSSSNRENELLPTVQGYVMKQWYALYVFLYSYEFVIWPDCFVGHSCPGSVSPESGPLSLICCITTMLGTLLMIGT